MSRPRQVIAIGVLVGAAAFVAGCGSEGTKVSSRAAVLFSERCGGCHTFQAAGAEGSILGVRPTGPNLDKRRETKRQVLFAIRNGGFSGGIMPQNIAVGKDAEILAEFVAKYAGRGADSSSPPRSPDGSATRGFSAKRNGAKKKG